MPEGDMETMAAREAEDSFASQRPAHMAVCRAIQYVTETMETPKWHLGIWKQRLTPA